MQPGFSFMQSGLALLSELSDADIDWLLGAGAEKDFEARATIVKQGAAVDSLYIVLQGLLTVSLDSAGGKELATLGPGQTVGEMSFLESRPASATVQTREGSKLLGLPMDVLEAKIRADAEFAARWYRALAVITSRRLRELENSIGRWMQDAPIPDATTLHRWEAIAHATQDFKQLLIQTEQEFAARHDAGDVEKLTAALNHFASFINEKLGDASDETIDAREELGARIQRELLPFFLKSRLGERFYSKPRGYSGDFLALEMIDDEPSLESGTCLDHALPGFYPMAAIRNRRQQVVEAIQAVIGESKDRTTRIASFAAGALREVFDVFAQLSDPAQVHVTAIDFDPQAVDYVAGKRNAAGLTDQIQLSNENLLYIATGRCRTALESLDLIYSFDLADYLDDKLLIRFLNWARRALRPGGKIVLGTFHRANPGKVFMDHVLEWKVIPRTEEEMNDVFQRSAFARPCTRIVSSNESQPQVFYLAECER